jgi:HEAT repeat protein
LIRCLADADDGLRWQAAFALGKIGGPAIPALLAALDSPVLWVQRAALDALAGITPAVVEAVPDVRRLAASAPNELRPGCLAALVRLTGDINAGLSGLVALLASTDVEQCREAIERIGELQYLALNLAPTVEQCLSHQSAAVRATAALALGRIGAKNATAIDGLIARLKDVDGEVRANAGIALAALGAAAIPALPALNVMQADPERRPAAVAKAAVERIARAV